METQQAVGPVDSSPCPTVPAPRRGRPVQPTSYRQAKPWLAARVSRGTFYKAKKTWEQCGLDVERSNIDLRRMVNDAALLRARMQYGLTPAEALADYLSNGVDLTTPPRGRYITYHEAQLMDSAKKRRTTGPKAERVEETMRPEHDTLGPIAVVENHQVVKYL